MTKTKLKKYVKKHIAIYGKMGEVGGKSKSPAKVEAAKRNFKAWHLKQGHKVT
jgi:hypothetical protein